MGDGVRRMIWCDACRAENWDEVSRWVRDGTAATRSGTLTVRAWCRACDAELPAGSSAEAVTVHHGRPEATGWEDGYLGEAMRAKTGWEEV